MLSLALSLCGPVERCLVIARWRVSVGWCQVMLRCYMGENRTLCHCSVGALGFNGFESFSDSTGAEIAERAKAEAILEEVISQCPGYPWAGGVSLSVVVRWNDAPERTQAEVVAAFDRAILLARARGV